MATFEKLAKITFGMVDIGDQLRWDDAVMSAEIPHLIVLQVSDDEVQYQYADPQLNTIYTISYKLLSEYLQDGSLIRID